MIKKNNNQRRVGVWLIGAYGGISTCLIAGIEGIKRGLYTTAGLVTELPQAPRPRFAIHVASYKTRTSAQQDVQTYRKQGYPVHLARVDIPKRGVFYRVLVGQFLTRQDAGKAAETLKQIGITGYAAVVNLPKPASVPPPPDRVTAALIVSPAP